MTGYTKLFGSIIASTIWAEDDQTRIIWITMLAMANQHGEVEASIPGLAKFANVPIEATENALEKLKAKDKYSRSKEFDGRRIEEIDGGWLILNHAKYRAKLNEDDRREYLRVKQQEQRNKRQHGVNIRQQMSTASTQTEAEAEAQTEKKRKEGAFDSLIPKSLNTDAFKAAWDIWVSDRAARRKPITQQAAKLQLEKLSKWGVVKAILAINNAIEGGWQGLFEPREAKKPYQKPLAESCL